LQNETVVKRYSPEEMVKAINDGGEILQKIENKNQTLSFILKAYYSKTGKFEFIKKTPFPVANPSPEYIKEYDSYIESLKKYGKQVLIVPSATKQIAVNNPDEQFCIDKKNNLSNLYDLIEDRFTYLDNALKQDYTSGDISALKTANTELNNALDQLVTFTKSEDCIKCKDVCDEAKEKLKTFNDRKQYLDKQFNEKITDWKTWVWQGLEDTFGSSAAFCMKKCDNLKYGFIERLVSKNLCQGFCMISEVFMNIVNWSFQFLKSAISTDTSEDYEAPDFQNTSL
jgi:hypothetical protein